MGEIPGKRTMRQCPGISGISSSDFRTGRRQSSRCSCIPAESPANRGIFDIRRNNRVASRRNLHEMRTNFLAYPQPPS
ncbi:hypothetical protein C7S15_6595 [Burkholderia cepacia]|nr:hypothetical protein [Burkholderia cepacia]